MAPCTHHGMKRLFYPKGKRWPRSLRSFSLASLLVKRYMRQDRLVLAAGRVRSKKKKNRKKKDKKSRPIENTPRNPHQPGDRDHLETARRKHAPRVSPYSPVSIDAGFVEIGVVQHSQSVKTTNSMSHTLAHAHTRTDRLIK